MLPRQNAKDTFTGRTVLSQLMDLLPLSSASAWLDIAAITKWSALPAWTSFRLGFAQLTYRESLRDMEASLGAFETKLYRTGFQGNIARNTLAHANEHRDWRTYADLAQVLIR